MPRRTQPVAIRRGPLPLLIGGILLVVLIAALVAIVLSSDGSPGLAEPALQQVTVSGAALPSLPQSGADPAVGLPIPVLHGTGLDGEAVEIGPDSGAQAIVVLAHWCPHCQAELPVLTEWLSRNGLPAGVRVVALSTAIDPGRPNYPPSAWLQREGWTQPTLIDDASSSALAALGLNTFPGFVFVHGDGTVAARTSGEIGAERFAAALASLAP